MNDDSALGTVRDSLTTARDSLTEVHMSTPLDTIVRHGRAARRRHRLIGLAGTGAVAATAALAVGLAALLGASARHGHHPDCGVHAGQQRQRHGHADHQPARSSSSPSTLQSDLEQDGIPAMVTVGSFCSSDPAPAGFLQVVSIPRGAAASILSGSDRDDQSRRRCQRGRN